MAVPLTILVALIAGIISIIVAIFFSVLVLREDPGNEKMIEISSYIEKGATTYLAVQYSILSIFVVILFQRLKQLK
jgi:K(+)-stimulated pyrophosphate-energized sodium pump